MYKLHFRLLLTVVLAVCLTTAACGGGDGSGGAVSNDTASTKSSSAPSAPSAPSASNTRFDPNANLTITYPTPTEEGEYGSIDFLINSIFNGYNFEVLEVL